MSSAADEPASTRKGRRLPLPTPSTDDSPARVTTFELFFDLVYVFAFTQVSRLMAETHSGFGVLQALIVLALMWWTWVGFSWISNQASVDQPLLRAGMTITMIAVFVAALTIPEAWQDLEGGLSGPFVFALAYTVVRTMHYSIYSALSAGDPALRRQLMIFLIALVPAIALILIGALVGGPAQLWLWIIAVVYDLAATRVGSAVGQGWRVSSAEHWAERYGLVVILALGESIVAIGVGVAQEPIDLAIILGSAASIVLSLLLWWSYFARLDAQGERRLAETDERARATLAADAYSYAHFVIIAGIIVTALGVEDAMKHVSEPEPFGWFGAIALGAGIAAFAVGTAVFAFFVGVRRPIMRIVEALVLLAAIPVLAMVPSMGALLIAVGLMGVIAGIEAVLHRRADDSGGGGGVVPGDAVR
ncbi:low temperature requirement protein A [Microbacterium sp. 4R-513]|uniref:low temperature requirement protein A n=1 Tax=Microbacterium sp. 4R-513 TaxID=2567934 RepID=UPI0013E196E3|nr:low temperature requirement protein A [Microbacterium sp. 4R-513]QIG39358.1 low temperature requirement protein A [Microbacterium sp. 4R-513]